MRLALLLVFFVTSAFTQEFIKLRAEFGFGYGLNYPVYQEHESNIAPLAYFAPSYRLNDKMVVGFKMEVALTRDITIGSYGPNVQYYFSNKSFRPFAGAGIGLYHQKLSILDISPPYPNTGAFSANEETSFGFYPRVGFDYRHITLTIDYNIVATSKALIQDNSLAPPNTINGHLENNYLGLKLGIFIGGGRKKK